MYFLKLSSLTEISNIFRVGPLKAGPLPVEEHPGVPYKQFFIHGLEDISLNDTLHFKILILVPDEWGISLKNI